MADMTTLLPCPFCGGAATPRLAALASAVDPALARQWLEIRRAQDAIEWRPVKWITGSRPTGRKMFVELSEAGRRNG